MTFRPRTHTTFTRHRPRLAPLLAVALLAAAAFATAASAAPARATHSAAAQAKPCWKKVLNDWFVDGRIDGTYPPSCLDAALQHLPPDAQQYSDFQDEAHRALATDAQWIKSHPHRKAHYNYGILGVHKGGGDWGPPPPSHPVTPGDPRGGGPDVSSIQKLIGSGSPSSTTSVPVPLLVLGGLAILLLLAGVASYLFRRFHGGPPRGPMAPADGPRQ